MCNTRVGSKSDWLLAPQHGWSWMVTWWKVIGSSYKAPSPQTVAFTIQSPEHYVRRIQNKQRKRHLAEKRRWLLLSATQAAPHPYSSCNTARSYSIIRSVSVFHPSGSAISLRHFWSAWADTIHARRVLSDRSTSDEDAYPILVLLIDSASSCKTMEVTKTNRERSLNLIRPCPHLKHLTHTTLITLHIHRINQCFHRNPLPLCLKPSSISRAELLTDLGALPKWNV